MSELKSDNHQCQVLTLYGLKNQEYLQKLNDELKRILDESYDGVYDFFYELLETDVPYKILRSRRCQVLFNIFVPIILLEHNDSIKMKGMFISDHALTKYKEKILKESGLIIDDIVIHGRGLQELYESLDRNYSCKRISIQVYHQSRNATIKKELKTKITSKMNVFDSEWKALSCQFVNSIYVGASPYISFVESFYENGGNIGQIKNREDFLVIENSNDYQKYQGESSFALFEHVEPPPIFRQLSYDCCLRIYHGEKTERITYIPYVILKNMRVDCLKKLLNLLCEKLPQEKTVFIRKDLNAKLSETGLAYQMKLLNVVFNHIYGLYLKHQYALMTDNLNLDKTTLYICYGEEIAEELYHLTYSDVQEILDLTVPFMIDPDKLEDDELSDELTKIDLNKGDLTDVDEYFSNLQKKMQMYFFLNGQIDERRAQNGELRKKGLTLAAFYQKIAHNKKHVLTATQLNSWDSGIASCNIYVAPSDVIACYVAAGEQSFRYVLEKHKGFLHKMIYEINRPLWNWNEESIRQKPEDLYREYLENHKKDEDIDLLKKFMEENRNKLEEWGIPEILK